MANIGSNLLTRFRTRLVAQATTPSDVFVSPDLNAKRLKLFRGTLTS